MKSKLHRNKIKKCLQIYKLFACSETIFHLGLFVLSKFFTENCMSFEIYSFSILYRDYRVEWEKIKLLSEKKKAEELKNKSSEMKESNLLTEIPIGRELSDVYLRHPANESSSDSEGEEAPYHGKFLKC